MKRYSITDWSQHFTSQNRSFDIQIRIINKMKYHYFRLQAWVLVLVCISLLSMYQLVLNSISTSCEFEGKCTTGERRRMLLFYVDRIEQYVPWTCKFTWWRHQMETFPRHWPFVRGIHRWIPYHKGKWRGAPMFSLFCAWTNSWANNQDAGDLRCVEPIMTSQ